MWNLLNDARGAIEKLGLDAEVMQQPFVDDLIQNLVNKYVIHKKVDFPIWNNLIDYESVFDPEGWRILSGYCDGKETILLFEPNDEKNAILFKNGVDIPLVLSEMHGFVFYLTDINTTFLICFNDHDFLIGSGDAKEWICSLKESAK